MNSLASGSRTPANPFDAIRHSGPHGDYWTARELQEILEYETWRNFADSIERARLACENSGQDARDHFVPSSKTIPLPKGAERDVLDFRLSRYACYLIAMNGDPRKKAIANAQTYFAVQTRFAEQVQAQPTPSGLPAAVGMEFLQQFAGNVVLAIQQQAQATKEEVKAEMRTELAQQIGALPATGPERSEVRRLVRQVVGQRTRLGLKSNTFSAVYNEVWDACAVGKMDQMTREDFPRVSAYLNAQLVGLTTMDDSGLFGGDR